MPDGSGRVVRLEAEDALLKGVEIATTQPAIPSGGKYVTGMDAGDDAVIFRPHLPPGLYEAVLGYRTPTGRKAFGMKVGDRTIENIFTESREDFARQKVGLIDRPPSGEITILARLGLLRPRLPGAETRKEGGAREEGAGRSCRQGGHA